MIATSNFPMNFRANEKEMLLEFQRGAHHHHSYLPDNKSGG